MWKSSGLWLMKSFGACVLLVLSTLVVAGCAATVPETTSAGTTEFHIGVGVPLTAGAVAFGEGLERGVRVAASEFNRSEAARDTGITFAVVAGDDRGDPKSGVTVANEFVSNSRLLGVVGHFNSGVTMPATPVYEQAKVVEITPSSTNTGLGKQGWKYFFRTCALDSDMARAAAAALRDEVKAKRVYIVDDGTTYGQGVAEQFKTAAGELGLTVAGQDRVNEGESDFSAVVTKIRAVDADAVFFGGTYMTAGPFARQLKDVDKSIMVASGGAMFNPDYISLAGTATAQGDIAAAFGSPIDERPEAQAFLEDYAEQFPGDPRQPYDAHAYDAAMVIMNAAAEVANRIGADKLNTPEGRQALRDEVAATDWEGATGRISFEGNGDLVGAKVTVYRVEDGAWKPFVDAATWPKAYE